MVNRAARCERDQSGPGPRRHPNGAGRVHGQPVGVPLVEGSQHLGTAPGRILRTVPVAKSARQKIAPEPSAAEPIPFGQAGPVWTASSPSAVALAENARHRRLPGHRPVLQNPNEQVTVGGYVKVVEPGRTLWPRE